MTPSPSAAKLHTQQDNPRWWQVGMVWLVVGGPLAVVVAATATAVIAWRGADTPLATAASGRVGTAQVPAVLGRNHAATPAPAAPRP